MPLGTRARPPRPEMSDRTPAPIRRTTPATTPVKVARSLWILSFAVGALLVIIAFLGRDRQLDALRELVVDLDPARDASTLDAVTELAFWGSLAAFAVVILVEAVLLRAVLRGRGRVRWALVLAVVAQVAASLLADAFLLATDEQGLYLRIALIAQLVSACAALVAGFTPGANAWFRLSDRTGRRPRP